MTIKKIPFIDLHTQYRSIRDEIRQALDRVVDSTSFILGEEVERFEKNFAAYLGAKYCVALNSGTSALHLALVALGVKEGDEVITSPHGFIAPAEAISYTGATPVFVDIDAGSLNLDVTLAGKAITRKTRAIMPVHLYGHPVDMARLMELAGERDIPVIEDAAQAHGAECLIEANGSGRWKKAGSIGDIGCFSFYPTKNLGACGEGGAVVTDSGELSEKIRMLRNHGQKGKEYLHPFIGYNYRMSAFQGAVLAVKLKKLDEWVEARRGKAALYDEGLKDTPLKTPPKEKNLKGVYHQYVVMVKNRDGLKRYLEERGVETGIYYPLLIPSQEAYRHLGYKEGDFPAAEACAKECLSLPLYPELEEKAIRYVCDCIRDFLAKP
ncbi:MAG: DegT/DnrJ/EryC1/StrS family aminotransferase [Candidatus Brocadiales bacterium]|nr:DegT/DnrJ/EryC1/StrS family aminotransferase [Candidatus Bathyanammoxibius amoris]